MYVYVMKCSIFYKIGFSKNPNNRLKTVKTHNPLDVNILATLKTDDYLSLEKQLHNEFSNKRSRGEWFELNEDDLLYLKVNYGFSFKIAINKIKKSNIDNIEILNEVKEVRIDNTKIDYFISYFESLYDCTINDFKQIKKACLKFDTDTIKEAIESLYNQDMDTAKAYGLIVKVCTNIMEIKTDPSKHIAKIVKAIMYKQYGNVLHPEDIEYIEENYNTTLDANDVIKSLNSKKFYVDSDEFFKFVEDKFLV